MEQVAFLMRRKALTNIGIAEIAKIFKMSESNLSHTFKTHFGITPKSYLISYKLELATDMLNNMNVTDVAYKLGYENISNFIKQFKKTMI